MSILITSGLKAVLIMAISLSRIIPVTATGVVILENIEVNSGDDSKQVRLQFDGEFSGDPLINFESGSISFRFNSVRTSPTLPSLIATESHSIIKAVRAFQVPETNTVHLDILLKSSRYKTEFPVITRSGKNIYLSLNVYSSSLPQLSSKKSLIREAEERVNNDQFLSENFTDDVKLKNAVDFMPIANEDWTVTLLTLVLSLLFVLLLIYLIAYVYNRFFSGRFPSIQGAIRIKQVSSFHVGPKQKVIVLEMNNRKFACGVTSSSINLITELEDESDQSFLRKINIDGKNNEINIDHARATYMKTHESNPQDDNSESNKSSKQDENHEIALNELDNPNEIFLKSNSKQTKDHNHLKNNNAMHSNPVRSPFEKKSEKIENLSYGSQTVQDFAKKLSKRLKFLKPIK